LTPKAYQDPVETCIQPISYHRILDKCIWDSYAF